MARRPVLDLDAEKTISFDTKGQEFEGFYLGYKTVRNDLSKDGISKLHIFHTEEGKVGIWGTKKLNDKLQGILEQTQRTQKAYMTFVTYGGKVKLGIGKTQHNFDVDFDDEITMDMGAVATQSDRAPAQPIQDIDDANLGYDDVAEEEAMEETPMRQPLRTGKPAMFTKEHTSKVANMLSKK